MKSVLHKIILIQSFMSIYKIITYKTTGHVNTPVIVNHYYNRD